MRRRFPNVWSSFRIVKVAAFGILVSCMSSSHLFYADFLHAFWHNEQLPCGRIIRHGLKLNIEKNEMK
jgi:hypothetical protein